MVRQYVGEAYRSDKVGNWSENHQYEFIRLTTGRIIFDNPRVRVKSDRPVMQRMIAEAMRLGLNRWARKKKLRSLLRDLYVMQCFAYSVAQTVTEAQTWMDPRSPHTPHLPSVYMLDSDRFFFDPLCSRYEFARFAGHKYARDKQDILDEAENNPAAGWNVTAVESIGDDAGIEELNRPKNDADITRKEIVIYEVWVPEISVNSPEQGFNGTIYTIAASGGTEQGKPEMEYLREPRPFYGPRTGPYTMFGVYPVPKDPYPLSPFAATYAQQRELNEVVIAINKALRDYKRVVLCSAENPDLARKLSKGQDSMVILIKGFAKDQIEVVEQGGITEQHIKQLEMALARLDRNTGIDESQRGNVDSAATATSIAVADGAAKDSIAFIKQEFSDSVVQMLESVSWYLYHDDRTEFPLGEEAMTVLGMLDPFFIGGPAPDDDPTVRWEDLELEIEPYSMERMNEALARAQYAEMMELAIAAAPLIPASPFYDWKKLFEKGADILNDPTFAEFYLPEVAQASQMMLEQQTMMEQQAIGADTAATQTDTRVAAQQPGLEREKIATQQQGIQQKAVSDKMKLKAKPKVKK